jgi:hypothetical protein
MQYPFARRGRRLIMLGVLGAVGLVLVGITLVQQGLLFPAPVQLTGPTVVSVAANRAWQSTGLMINSGQRVMIEYSAGSVTDQATVMPDANGWDYICGAEGCCEPLPDARRGALIGQIGRETFFIGNRAEITPETSGVLHLRINDCDDGLNDNSGTLQIQVAPTDL